MGRLVWHSVHAKILRMVVLAFIVGIAVASVALLVVVNNITRTSMIDGLQSTAKILADRSAAALIFSDARTAQTNLASAKNRQNIDALCLYDAKGDLFTAYTRRPTAGACAASVSPSTSTEVREYDGLLYVSVPVIEQAEFLGHIVIQANTHNLIRNQWFFALVVGGVMFVSLLVTYLLSSRFIKRSLVPLDALYRTSLHIADNPLSDSRALKISDDEIGRLVDVFNKMLDTLAKENRALLSSENRFRSLCENAPIGVFLKNELGEYDYRNARWEEICGLDDASSVAYTSFIEKNDRERYKTCMAQALVQGTPSVVEYQFQNPQHGNRMLMEYVCPLKNEAGQKCLIGSLLDVTELKVAQSELEKLAFYDPLTQLPNRRFFRDHLNLAMAHAQKEHKEIAIYMTDLDDFKKVNDSFGHDVGDELLVNIAQRLRDVLGDSDVVSRMGGDEFMILLGDIEDPTRLDTVSQRLLEALHTSASSGHHKVQVTGSIGIAIYPSDADNAEALLRYADMALYNAKGSGGNQVAYYSQELDAKIRKKVRMEQKLRLALEADALDVYIQPQYEAKTRSIFWGEALVRWIDEEDGFIPPDVFIPLAEDTGLIFQLGDFVTERVIRLLAESGDQLQLLGLRGISINLSAKQFFDPTIVDRIAQCFERYQVSPSLVEFELTETTVMDDVDGAIRVMEGLRALGCQLSIDDFGTGYSSLAYLKRFPLTSLKIDRSFIRDIPADQNDVEISCAIIALAHTLGLAVVAEGVETDEQAIFLADTGCEYLQGYFLDRPMPISDLLLRADPLEPCRAP